MKNYDKVFFQKYLPEKVKMKAIIHEHLVTIINKIIFNYFFLVILPSFFYYYSDLLKSFIPFFALEMFLVLMFIWIVYEVFNWYNDVWIVTSEGVTTLEWRLFGIKTNSIKYENIEGVELIQEGILDTFLKKGDIIIHKLGGDGDFVMRNASLPYEAINEIEKFSRRGHHDHHGHDEHSDEEHGHDDEENPGEHYDVIVKALSGVIEDYLQKSGYKKDNSLEKKEYIESVKKMKGTIDLNDDGHEDLHGHDEDDEEDEHHGYGHEKSKSKSNHSHEEHGNGDHGHGKNEHGNNGHGDHGSHGH